jgi:hypothetical protein
MTPACGEWNRQRHVNETNAPKINESKNMEKEKPMNKTLKVATLLAIFIISMIICLDWKPETQAQTYTPETTTIEYPYELVKVKNDNGTQYNYYSYNKITGILEKACTDLYHQNQMYEIIEKQEPVTSSETVLPYSIVSDGRGGCFVMDPYTGKTIQIHKQGGSKIVYEGE